MAPAVPRIIRRRADLLVPVAIIVGVQLLPRRIPGGIYGFGVVEGATLALQAIGLVLIYRANRIINFAQIQVGLVGATLFTLMMRYEPLLRGTRSVCPSCIGRTSQAVLQINFYLSLVISLAVSVGLSYLIYQVIVRRFASASRLVLTVATIFVAELLAGVQAGLPRLLLNETQREQALDLGAVPLPFGFSFSWGPARFGAPDVLTVGVALLAVGGLVAYFRASRNGIAIRASADNPSRVRTLGINVDRVMSRVWIVSGALSAAAVLLGAFSVGVGASPGGLSVGPLVRILSVAVMGSLASLPMTLTAAVAIGILENALVWAFGSTLLLDGLLIFIIAGVLMLQRYHPSRAEAETESTGEWRADREIRPIPAEMKTLPEVRRWLRGGGAILVLVLLGLPWVLSPAQTNLASLVGINAMVLLSLLILIGWAGQISLGQIAFAAVGGYIAAILPLPFLPAIVAGGLVGGALALAVGLPALRLRGLHLAVVTLAFALSTTTLVVSPHYLGRYLPAGLQRPSFAGMSLTDERTFYYFILIVLALVLGSVLGMRRSHTARALIAARDNELAAQSFGVNLVRARLGALAASGFIAALAGGVFAFHQFGVRADAFAPEHGVSMFLLSVMGGTGAVAGPLIGALYQGALTIGASSPLVAIFGVGGGGLLLLYLFPGGLAGIIFDTRDAYLRWLARRRRMVVPSILAHADPEHLRQPASIGPKLRRGEAVFVPPRYRLDKQWAAQLETASSHEQDDRG